MSRENDGALGPEVTLPSSAVVAGLAVGLAAAAWWLASPGWPPPVLALVGPATMLAGFPPRWTLAVGWSALTAGVLAAVTLGAAVVFDFASAGPDADRRLTSLGFVALAASLVVLAGLSSSLAYITLLFRHGLASRT